MIKSVAIVGTLVMWVNSANGVLDCAGGFVGAIRSG